MNNKELFLNLKHDLEYDDKDIYSNFHNVFGLDEVDFYNFCKNIDYSFDFNDKLNEKHFSSDIFSENNLSLLKNDMMKLGLSDDHIKKIIVKSPIITLYSDDLDSLYYLYKNNKYCGYTTLDKDGYFSTYIFNDNLKRNVVSNNYITDNMLNYYDVHEYTKENFDNLKSDNKVKNYYFKDNKKTKKH